MLTRIEMTGFKSFAKKAVIDFSAPVTAVVGPNGSGKSNVVEAIRFVLGEQSMKSLRSKAGADLIFKGSKILPKSSRASVTVTFNNSKRLFRIENTEKPLPLDYDEITVSREIFSDGAGVYTINGVTVRLKDVHELFASVNIGTSGYHIISQGEADRLLSANNRERREMIEEALGLKVYQYKIRDSERKLEKTATHMKEVESLRREIAPHMTFLKKQVDKIAKAEEIRNDLAHASMVYLRDENTALQQLRHDHDRQILEANQKRADLMHRLAALGEKSVPVSTEHESIIRTCEDELRAIQKSKDELSRSLGRIEGMISARETVVYKPTDTVVPLSKIETWSMNITALLDDALLKTSVDDILPLLSNIKLSFDRLISEYRTKPAPVATDDTEALKKEKDALLHTLDQYDRKEGDLREKIISLRREHENEIAKARTADADRFQIELALRGEDTKKVHLDDMTTHLAIRDERFQSLSRDIIALVGDMMRGFSTYDGTHAQSGDELARLIERLKIRLEESGGIGGTDVIKEYETTVERDAFLAKELIDIRESMTSLETLIADLKARLATSFETGVEKINAVFSEFFTSMFGGGSAFLSIVIAERKKKAVEDEEMEEEEENAFLERGIDIHVNLPHKKVRDLQMLSGGERSLVSIALLFAISQVNPPPCLVLDETDAALDEANSRRYGDMIERLSSSSQLIVITHNRETMSRAGILYGVTVGADGASKLLSIKFDDAVKIAK